MSVQTSPPKASWTSDLVHPIPLVAVATLIVNDHFLKGSGLLPGWLTGKISDFAGLFFFPLFLATLARGLCRLITRRDMAARRTLALVTAIATGAVFTAVKLVPIVNTWVSAVWGLMLLDPTDLIALPVIVLSVAFMLQRPSVDSHLALAPSRAARPAPRSSALNFAAVVVTGMASIATSQPRQPQVPLPPPATPAPQVAAEGPSTMVATDAPDACASLAASTCERSSTGTFVVIAARTTGSASCEITVLQATEIAQNGVSTPVDVLPAKVLVKPTEASTFALSFLRSVDPASITQPLLIQLQVQRTSSDGQSSNDTMDVSRSCVGR